MRRAGTTSPGPTSRNCGSLSLNLNNPFAAGGIARGRKAPDHTADHPRARYRRGGAFHHRDCRCDNVGRRPCHRTRPKGGRLVQRLRDTGAEVQFFPAAAKNPLRLLWNAHRIANVIRRDGVDLVHARSRAPAWSALIAARRTGVPFVTTYHGAYSEKSDVKRLYNSVMARGDAVIANSHYTSDLIRMRYGTSARQAARHLSRRRRAAVRSRQRRARARRRRARPLGHRRQQARRPARRAPDARGKARRSSSRPQRCCRTGRALDDTVFILAGDAQRRRRLQSGARGADPCGRAR